MSVIMSTNTNFLEYDFIKDHKSQSKIVFENIEPQQHDIQPTLSNNYKRKKTSQPIFQELGTTHCSGRIVRQPDQYLEEAFHAEPIEDEKGPLSYRITINDSNKKQWVEAMNKKIESMYLKSV